MEKNKSGSNYSSDPEIRLWAAVVRQAIQDACATPAQSLKPQRCKPQPLALSALDFITRHGAGVLSALDINAKQFNKRLVALMHSDEETSFFGKAITAQQRRAFRFNWNAYQRLTM